MQSQGCCRCQGRCRPCQRGPSRSRAATAAWMGSSCGLCRPSVLWQPLLESHPVSASRYIFQPRGRGCCRAKAAAQAQPGAAAKPAPAVAGEKAFRVGAHVIVQGVTARPELNGRTGVCEALDATSGRWTIRFDVDNTLVKLQPKKLRALAQVLPPPVPLALSCPALTVFVFALRTMQQLPLIFRAHHPW